MGKCNVTLKTLNYSIVSEALKYPHMRSSPVSEADEAKNKLTSIGGDFYSKEKTIKL